MKHAANDLVKISEKKQTIAVGISNEVVTLLSQQLYQSPLKAIEELVVNSYDADATHCRLYVPDATALQHQPNSVISVFDDGLGLSDNGMINLWHVGRSDKRSEEIARRAKRTQIGKFGIGKLAVFVISNQLSYVSKSGDKIWFSSLDFREFHEESDGKTVPVKIDLRTIRDLKEFKALPWVSKMIADAGITSQALDSKHWTLAILEDFKEKAWDIKLGRLKWVLRTAMPLRAGFQLFLNKDEVKSSKEDIPVVASFNVSELDKERWAALKKRTGENWEVKGKQVISETFKSGITGEVMVTERTLPGKSDDILRSNGFFIRVRGRLIAQEEPFFGMNPLYHGTMNRLRADIEADDLDAIIKAPREEIEASPTRDKFEAFLREVFQEARNRWDNYQKALAEKEERKKETDRSFVSSEIIERPIAGAMVRTGGVEGADADRTWFYLAATTQDWKALAEELYTAKRKKFNYEYRHLGTTERIIKFHAESRKFVMNLDHEFIAANSGDELTKTFLHDFVLAEVVLEARLRLSSVSPAVIGEVLQDRDALLRALAKDHPLSCQAVAQQLRDSINNQYDFEIALVAAARALGFVTKHVSGAGQPDAVARLVEYPRKDIVLTIEAKSSADVPQLPQLDFAGLREHMKPYKAIGCLLVAPAYPGSGEKSQVYLRSREQKVSCWTATQLAQVVDNIEKRHITAKQVAEIVSTKFDPQSVDSAVNKVLSEPAWDQRALRSALLAALDALEARMEDRPRSVDMVATEVSRDAAFQGISVDDVGKALAALASISQGALQIDGDTVIPLTSVSEIRRRAQPQLIGPSQPRRISTVREDLPSDQSDDKGH